MIYPVISWFTLYFMYLFWLGIFLVCGFIALWITIWAIRCFVFGIKDIIDTV